MSFYDDLKIKMHLHAKHVYRVTKKFPRDELYGMTSQLRRASLSIVLNFIEGFARRRGKNCKVFKNFLEISFGSSKETKYLIYFAYTENYINTTDYEQLMKSSDEIGKMLWHIIKSYKKTKNYN